MEIWNELVRGKDLLGRWEKEKILEKSKHSWPMSKTGLNCARPLICWLFSILNHIVLHNSWRSPGEGIGYPLQYSCMENSHGQRCLAGYSPWGHKESDMTEILSTAQHTIHDLLNLKMWNTDPEELQIWRNYGYKWSTISYMWILDCLEDWWPQPTHCSRVNCALTIVDQLLCKSGLAKNNHMAFTSPSNQDSCCSTQSKPRGLSCGCRTHQGDTGPPLLTVLPSDIYTELCVWAMCIHLHMLTLANLPEIFSMKDLVWCCHDVKAKWRTDKACSALESSNTWVMILVACRPKTHTVWSITEQCRIQLQMRTRFVKAWIWVWYYLLTLTW